MVKHRRIENVMTREVVRVGPETTFKEVAETLAEHRISGVPVVDADGKVTGVVSESDLTARQAAQEYQSPGGGRLRSAVPSRSSHRIAVKAHALVAAQLMTTPAVTVRSDASVPEAARTMAQHHVDRLPVVDDGHLVGMVTRSDLLQVFLRTDTDIKDDVVDVMARGLWLSPTEVQVTVRQGVVTLKGRLEYRADADIAHRTTAQVDGVVQVVDQLSWYLDGAEPAFVDHGRGRYDRP